mmetsp:Transcript_134721/g.430415  ORF Transcript_134721/g.430415 Transcript_134721/m.430415 type:complete len:421 (+) Transcript_134721:88-1350(+)
MAAEVCYDAPQVLPDATMMLVAVQRLATIPEAKDREEAFLTLLKLVDGVLGAPEDPKKRRVKKGNATFQQKVGRFAAGIDFLKAAGFVDSDDPEAEGEEGRDTLLSMPVAYLLRLTDAHHTLARAAQEVGITPPPMPGGGFNPYVANMQAADTTRTVKAGESWKTDAEKIREEVKKRERELKAKLEEAPPIDMQPSAFWLSSGRRLEDIIRETQSVEDRSAEDKSADNALMQSQLAQSKAAINGSNTKFESADKRRLAELSHKRVHAFCILRIICPDKSVLQVHFRAKERGDKVLEMISPLLAPNVRELGWYIYQSPPMMKLGPKETLAAAGFTPGASLYLGFEGGARPPAPYLEASLVSQLGPPPAEAGRGVNAPAGPTFSGEAMGWGTGQKLGAPAPAALAASAPAAGADGGPVPMEQ